jgi:hypothetical protein
MGAWHNGLLIAQSATFDGSTIGDFPNGAIGAAYRKINREVFGLGRISHFYN